MLASSHKGEELKFLNMIKSLINKYQKIQFFIAPRHLERVNKIISKTTVYLAIYDLTYPVRGGRLKKSVKMAVHAWV